MDKFKCINYNEDEVLLV